MSDESLEKQLIQSLGEPFGIEYRESHYYILDSIACNLHNDGHSLLGNTEESDLRWLARMMWQEKNRMVGAGIWDTLPQPERDAWIETAGIAVKCLPALMGRIAHRSITISKALRSLERASREEVSKAHLRRANRRYE